MSSLRRWRLVTTLGSEQDPRSRRTSPQAPSRSRGRDRSTEEATSSESAMTEVATPALPGLETVEPPRPQAEHRRWLEHGPSRRLMLFSGRSHPALAEAIAERLGIELGEVELRTFANGETYCRYEESVRGADVFLVQTGCEPVDRNLIELLIMIQAAKLASARRVTAVIPWFPSPGQEKKPAPREPITGK